MTHADDEFLSDSELAALHKRSSHHRASILKGATCGCFYCQETFPPTEIEDWCDEVDDGGQTALCPRCGIDAVLPDDVTIPLSPWMLKRMYYRYFL